MGNGPGRERSNSTSVSTRSSTSYYTASFVYGLAALLTVIGAASDASQKLFGVSPVFGIEDVSQELPHPANPARLGALIYLLLGSAAVFIASISIEKSFTYNFVAASVKKLGCRAEITDTDTDTDQADSDHISSHHHFEPSLSLNLGEELVIGGISLSAAVARSLSSIMGFYTIDNSKRPAITYPVMACSGVDGIQTMATDGDYFKRFWLVCRLKFYEWLWPDHYQSGFSHRMSLHLDREEDRHTSQGDHLHTFMLLVGAIAVMSDVGIAKLSIDDFADLYHISRDTSLFNGLETTSLVSLFLLMYTIDARTLANKVAAWFYPTDTSQSYTMPKFTIGLVLAMITVALGGSMSALSAYTGTNYLLGKWFPELESNANKAISWGIAALKLSQFLAVEGCYTMETLLATARDFALPSCRAITDCLRSQRSYSQALSTTTEGSDNSLTEQLIEEAGKAATGASSNNKQG